MYKRTALPACSSRCKKQVYKLLCCGQVAVQESRPEQGLIAPPQYPASSSWSCASISDTCSTLSRPTAAFSMQRSAAKVVTLRQRRKTTTKTHSNIDIKINKRMINFSTETKKVKKQYICS